MCKRVSFYTGKTRRHSTWAFTFSVRNISRCDDQLEVVFLGHCAKSVSLFFARFGFTRRRLNAILWLQ